MLCESLNECLSNNLVLTNTKLYTREVLTSCYTAMDEGISTLDVVNTSNTYTHSLVLEILDNVKDSLLKLYQTVLSALNNYILNNANLADKYRNYIIERYEKLDHKIEYKTYEYPHLKEIPADARNLSYIEADVKDMVNYGLSESYQHSKFQNMVYANICKFSKIVIGTDVDEYDIKGSVKAHCMDSMRGQEVIKLLSYKDLDSFIDDIIKFKDIKNEITSMKTSITKYYNTLRNEVTSSFRMTKGDNIGEIRRMKDPAKAALMDNQVQQYGMANVELVRMFNAFINIYNTAFNTKLSIIQDRVTSQRNIITQMMQETSLFAATNNKTPNRKNKPYDTTKLKM